MFVITPAFKAIYATIEYKYPDTVSEYVETTYISANESPMNKDELRRYLIKNRVLEKLEDL